MQVRLPSPDNLKIDDENLKRYLATLVQALERAIAKLPETPMTRGRIKVTNNTKTYAFDATADTLATTRLIVGTLIEQLQESGSIS